MDEKARRISQVVLGICSLLFSCILIAATVKSVHIHVMPNHSTFNFLLDKKVSFDTFALSKPYRIVIDLNNTRFSKQPAHKSLIHTPVKNMRVGYPNKSMCRLVLDLKYDVTYRATMKEIHHKPYLQVVIQHPKTKKSITKRLKKALISQPMLPKRLRDIVVVIDPGHGGKDPGATGPRGYHEKAIVLSIAKKLYRDLKRVPGLTPKLTRTGDYYIPLRKRLQIARKYKGDMFISIHADAYLNSRSHGASVYALSQRGATSEAARWLAGKENYSELGGVDLEDKSNMLRSVLIDLSQTATIEMSLMVGSDILQRLEKITRLHKDKVEQARFVVLKSPDIPSILVETGFISNPREERRLVSRKYQNTLASALAKGVEAYFKRRPPQGTYFAKEKRNLNSG